MVARLPGVLIPVVIAGSKGVVTRCSPDAMTIRTGVYEIGRVGVDRVAAGAQRGVHRSAYPTVTEIPVAPGALRAVLLIGVVVPKPRPALTDVLFQVAPGQGRGTGGCRPVRKPDGRGLKAYGRITEVGRTIQVAR